MVTYLGGSLQTEKAIKLIDKELQDLIQKGAVHLTIQCFINSAYFTVPIWIEHQKYLRFMWKDNRYEFACLPFGLASAPRVFTKIMKPVAGLLRQLGIRIIIYLDDMLIMADSVELAEYHAQVLQQ
jgi:hypothetical protein